MTEIPVTFECRGQQIVGMIHLPPGRERVPAVLMLHGFTGTKVECHRMFVKLGRLLAKKGIASLRFDFRGSGDSAGNFEDITLRSEVADALEAIKFMARHKRFNSRRLGLVGMSLGAAVASYVVGRERTRFQGLVLWAPVAEGTGILDQLSTPEAVASLAQTGLTDYGGNLVSVQFIRQFAEMKPLREVVKCRCPVLIVHGGKDETVPVSHADQYELALRSPDRPVKKIVIPDADHTFNKHVWERRLLDETVAWLTATL
ncbi:MAG: alpha/beta fold hydrolase [Verrucomicrobiae bacterium]|nr:alpha/beta fold hydrolase [Verrucomicrobiae bacterium]